MLEEKIKKKLIIVISAIYSILVKIFVTLDA